MLDIIDSVPTIFVYDATKVLYSQNRYSNALCMLLQISQIHAFSTDEFLQQCPSIARCRLPS